MANNPVDNSAKNPNLNTSAEQLRQESKTVVILSEQIEDALYIKKPTTLLKYKAIAIIVLALLYPITNVVLWGTIIAHVFIAPVHIMEAIFVMRSTRRSVMYTKFKTNRLIVLILGIGTEVWLFIYIIITGALIRKRAFISYDTAAKLRIYIEIMATTHFVLNLLMAVEHYFLFAKKQGQQPNDNAMKKNAV
jgi:hypothetical protein